MIKEMEYELEVKNKKIKEIMKEKKNIEKRAEDECNTLREELDLLKERIIHL